MHRSTDSPPTCHIGCHNGRETAALRFFKHFSVMERRGYLCVWVVPGGFFLSQASSTRTFTSKTPEAARLKRSACCTLCASQSSRPIILSSKRSGAVMHLFSFFAPLRLMPFTFLCMFFRHSAQVLRQSEASVQHAALDCVDGADVCRQPTRARLPARPASECEDRERGWWACQ